MKKPIRVLVIDDSALIRAMLTELLQQEPDLEVVGAARDPYEAREMIKELHPDVLTLDIEMPKMNGLAFLSNLMRLRPMPVIMISTLTEAGAPATLEALELGAVDFMPKPKDQGAQTLIEYRHLLVEKLRAAVGANLDRPKVAPSDGLLPIPAGKRLKSHYVCAIGASTGGTEAIKDVLKMLPLKSPPIVITQHIPASFSASFAKRLDNMCAIKVFEAEHNQPIRAGCAYLAPGDKHLELALSSHGLVCQLRDSTPVNRHKPSVEVLFDSVLKVQGAKALGILLTGMGSDGAEALLRMKEGGCPTIAQDEASSVVWGMPGVAVKIGGAERVLPLGKIAQEILLAAYA